MIILVSGGSGSGKSEFAENKAVDLNKGELIYIATMYPYDEEAFKKIDRHKEMRKNKNFTTYECYTNLSSLQLPKNSTVLLDCVSNLVANEMFNENGAKEETVESIIKGIKKIGNEVDNLVIVSNEIFSDGIKYDAETMRYIKYSGEINNKIAMLAQEVIEVVYSIPIYYKGGERNVGFL